MEFIKKNLKSILIIVVIFGGLIVSLILIKNPTIFKSKAAADIDYPSALNISDASNQPLKYKGEGVYIIKDSKIKLGIKDFSKLIQNYTLDPNKAFETKNHIYSEDELIKMGYVKYSEDEIAERCAVDKGWTCSLVNWSIVKGIYKFINPEGETYASFVTNQYPPLSEIPPSCQSIGPGNMVINPPASKLSMLVTREETKAISECLEQSKDDNERNSCYGKIGKVGADSPLWFLWDISNWGFGNRGLLPYMWQDSGNKPLTAGGEDPRWVVRALSIITTLDTLKRGNKAPYEWSNNQINVRSNYVWDEIHDTWFKVNGKSLDTACKKVLELKEQVLLQGIWLPSDDTLAKFGRIVE